MTPPSAAASMIRRTRWKSLGGWIAAAKTPTTSGFLQWRPSQEQPLLADAREADQGLGLVAAAAHVEDHPLTPLAVDDVVAGPDAEVFRSGGLGRRCHTSADGGLDDAGPAARPHAAALGPRPGAAAL